MHGGRGSGYEANTNMKLQIKHVSLKQQLLIQPLSYGSQLRDNVSSVSRGSVVTALDF